MYLPPLISLLVTLGIFVPFGLVKRRELHVIYGRYRRQSDTGDSIPGDFMVDPRKMPLENHAHNITKANDAVQWRL